LGFLLNVAVAFVLGAAIGLERQIRQRTAGLRTNTLVCVGAALFVSLGVTLNEEATARIASYVVSGIGFLGGGVILREGFNVRGMNTAATLWCSAAVGTLARSGRLAEAGVGTAMVLAIHLGLRPAVRKIDQHFKGLPETDAVYHLQVDCQTSQAGVVRNILMRHVNSQANMMIQGISTRDSESADTKEVVAEIVCTIANDKYMNDLVARLNIEPSVTAVSWKKV
jgi:putative Mg2+ transporter-C (MgtC) family protein